ncbi:beta/gamma crystallin domain-containing protein [Sinomonas sp. ASV322]|uniref:beta/gamma crystallin domain-containing protein n=1 Tax=Sinomonas sp. ASV322 TaxID=3041920 RepID=UPI0027DE6691|nr:beta/gamma crystallin domain-containing protein [Sinomonas sp. ASV322]MDQ4504160.1 beta/gamma crystallin domain-containing protein [Sinomonas sp. ASV322]
MRKVSRTFLAAGVAAALVLSSAAAANAINRVDCSSYEYLWLQSGQTTCWANAGYVDVYLADVQGLSAGNNAGYIKFSSGGWQTFYHWRTAAFPRQAVGLVAIY